MAGMVGARRALLAARYSPRGALASPVRRVDSPPSLPADRTCLRSLVPHRGAGNFASEQIDGDYHSDEWGARNTENYRESHRADRPSHQVQADIPSTDSSVGADRIRGVNSDGNTNAHYRRNPGQTEFPNHHEPYISARVNNGAPGFNDRQPYVSVNTQYRSNSLQPRQMCGPYGFANPHEPYTSAKANCEAPGYKDKEPYGGGGPYNQQTPSGDLPNTHQQYSHTQGNNSANSGNGTGQTYHHYHGSDAYRSGYNSQNNQQAYDNRHYGYGPSGQSYQKSTGNDQQVFQKQQVDQISAGNSANRPGSSSQYGIPSRFNEEHVARFQQGHNGDIGHNISHTQHSPYVSSKIDAQSNLPGRPMNVNTAVQGNTHGIYKEKHFDIQPNALAGNHLSNASAPYQDGIYRNHLLTESPLIDESSGVSDVACGKSKVTVEEMDKLCEDRKIKEAVELLALLQEEGTVVHASQYCKLMQACGDVASLAEARKLHNLISQSALAADTDINNKILEMYSKCGSMEDAKKLFSSSIAQCNLISWNTMIAGFVHNGLGEEATDFFDQFMQTGDNPNSAMFTHVFLACGILGSVDEGMLHFESMQKDFGITPTMEHYVSIVNMLGQSGYIDEACEFVEQMPVEPSIDVWESLMNMCRLNGFLEIGDRCAQIVERLDSSRLNEQSKIGLFPVDASELTKEKERKKANAVEARSKVHEYRAGDRSHPEHLKIYEELRYLAAHMKEAGYIADTRFVLHDVDQETKEDALLAHSERLAVSYGLITSAARSPIRVIKNLRSCGDCHTAFKIISKLVGRLIIARDAKRFHHFENGVCSCKDYW
ncbi:pentatricopeptide repeat-containing protein At4g32450, mitochondrial-like [Oryza brachyantha]|uniref:DYW domain-containing protein n=1 Tax=Oryza brachyantha TaxID=4533 RepID=J3L3V5_ORYBR|nr:pentatricopeptide repeat-containing protein At4g32450, mitochondrial-like [Oryza brachyantha]